MCMYINPTKQHSGKKKKGKRDKNSLCSRRPFTVSRYDDRYDVAKPTNKQRELEEEITRRREIRDNSCYLGSFYKFT